MALRLMQIPRAAEIAARLVLVELGLRFLPLKTLVSRLSKPRRRTTDLGQALRLAQGCERRLFSQTSCLRVSLTLFWLGEDGTRLRIGLPEGSERFEAHAWVEKGDQIFSVSRMPARCPTLASFEKSA